MKTRRLMKKTTLVLSCLSALIIGQGNVVILGAEGASATLDSQITVKETRLPGGDSEIRVTDPRGKVTATYRINLSTHHHPATGPDDPVIKAWKSRKYGAFVCFNSNQFSGTEFCSSADPLKDFNPTRLDVRQWVQTIKDAKMTYAVLTVRHTSEFLLWDSRTSRATSTNSTVKTDVVKAYVEECRRQDIAPGFYYCLWGGKFKPHPNARALILAQLHELATQYGPIPYFWIDMGVWKPANLSIQEIYDSLKNVRPKTVVMFNQHIQDGRQIRYFPTDVLNGEMRAPPAEGHNPVRTIGGKKYYLPFEYEPCSQTRVGRFNLGGWDYQHASWFTYGSGKPFKPSKPFPAEFLYRRITLAYDRGADAVLLSCAPDHTGRFRKEDVEQLTQLGRMLTDPSFAPPKPLTAGGKATASGVWDKNYTAAKAFDNDPGTRWGGAPDTKEGWLAVDLGEPKTFRRVWISEGWDRVRKFELQVKKDDVWKTIYTGATLGADFSAEFEPVTAQHVRLNVLEATDVPTIWEVQLFEK